MRIALPAVIAADAMATRDPAARVIDLAGETMGTVWTVRLVLPDGASAETVRAGIAARLAGLVGEMSHWSPTSLLTRYNRSAAGTWTTLPPDFAQVMAGGLAIAAATDGAFDPAIGRLVDLWGFGPVPTTVPTTVPPATAAIDQARAASGWRRLAYDPADRRLRQPGGLTLDLSGIAKGHAVDAIADLLARMGIRHCLVEIGGELVGRGVRPDGEPWWVDLETPPGMVLAPLRIALHGLAVATSGDYRRGAHTLDPRTGRAAATGIVAASVIAGTALEADAWATVLTVLGVADGVAAAAEAGIAARLVVVGNGEAREFLTPALIAMLAED